ncbi:hypothetical protein MRX96_051085 [Rhipicephalus microplus]
MVVVPLRTTAHTFLQPSTCTSPTCAQNAIYLSHLLSWDDMNPCDDFYTFVCRRWNSQASTATEEESPDIRRRLRGNHRRKNVRLPYRTPPDRNALTFRH